MTDTTTDQQKAEAEVAAQQAAEKVEQQGGTPAQAEQAAQQAAERKGMTKEEARMVAEEMAVVFEEKGAFEKIDVNPTVAGTADQKDLGTSQHVPSSSTEVPPAAGDEEPKKKSFAQRYLGM